MSHPKLAQRTVPENTVPRGESASTAYHRGRTLSPALEELADSLRARGHSVHTASVQPSSIDDQRLAPCAAHFFGQALGLSEATGSVRAHIRVYLSNGLLFLELTQLTPRSFESATRLRSGRDALNQLCNWATTHGHVLSIRRGPRDQLRLALMVVSAPNSSEEQGNTPNGLVKRSRSHRPKSQHSRAVAARTTGPLLQNPKET